MPIYDFECEDCGWIQESIQRHDVDGISCHCGGIAKKIISVSGQYIANQDAVWLKSVTDVVDKDNKAPHVQEFIKNPTRKNYQRWMKGEGLRPFEPGEKPQKPPLFDERAHHEKVWQKHQERKKIVIHRR